MIRLGVIGTNWITERFLKAAKLSNQLKLTAVYSRTKDRAESFAVKHGAKATFTDLERFLASDAFDAVYIASPTAFHKEQTILALSYKKHVLVEKPMASNAKEAEAMIEMSQKHGVVLMEAMKTTQLPNFREVESLFERIGPVRRILANFCQYSSRYDRYKEGEVLNAFKPELSNGALMDLGVYTVYPIIKWFGQPKKIQASAIMLDSGVDGSGTVTLTYPGFEANLLFSKITNSDTPSEIQGENGSILIDKWSDMQGITWMDKQGHKTKIDTDQDMQTMLYEALDFVDCIHSKRTQSEINPLAVSKITMEVLDEARQQIGLIFPADTHMNG